MGDKARAERGRRWRAERDAMLPDLIAYYEAGNSLKACGERFSLPIGTVYYRLRYNTATRLRNPGHSDLDDDVRWAAWVHRNNLTT